MTAEVEWRRVCDWKQTVLLVDSTELEQAFLDAHGLVKPEERLASRFPRLARLVASTHYARVDRKLATLLHRAGVPTYEVGYHRVSEGLYFAEEGGSPRRSTDLDMGELVACLAGEESDEDEDDRLRADAVDAVLRILSEGMLTERAVIVAELAPPLSSRAAEEELESGWEDFEALDPSTLPDVAPVFVERVASALSTIRETPEVPPGPNLPPEVRRAYQRKAFVVGLVALTGALFGMRYAPWVAVFSFPVLVLCAIIIVLHAVALRAEGSAKFRD